MIDDVEENELYGKKRKEGCRKDIEVNINPLSFIQKQ